MELDGWGKQEDLGRNNRGETIIRIYSRILQGKKLFSTTKRPLRKPLKSSFFLRALTTQCQLSDKISNTSNTRKEELISTHGFKSFLSIMVGKAWLQKWLSLCQQEVQRLVVHIMMVCKETEGMEPEAGLGGNCQRPALKNSSLPSGFYNLQRCLCQAQDIRYSNTWTYGGHCRFKP